MNFYILEAETETINHDLEQQFNEGLQAKITHTHHIGLGFHGESNSTSSSSDWKHEPAKLKFVPARTEVGAAMDHVVVDETPKDEEKSSDKQVKKRKSKSSP